MKVGVGRYLVIFLKCQQSTFNIILYLILALFQKFISNYFLLSPRDCSLLFLLLLSLKRFPVETYHYYICYVCVGKVHTKSKKATHIKATCAFLVEDTFENTP